MWVLIFCLPMFANTEEPRWMSSLPHPSNSSFYYVRIEALATDVESAKKLCLKYLASRIELEQSVRISESRYQRKALSSSIRIIYILRLFLQ